MVSCTPEPLIEIHNMEKWLLQSPDFSLEISFLVLVVTRPLEPQRRQEHRRNNIVRETDNKVALTWWVTQKTTTEISPTQYGIIFLEIRAPMLSKHRQIACRLEHRLMNKVINWAAESWDQWCRHTVPNCILHIGIFAWSLWSAWFVLRDSVKQCFLIKAFCGRCLHLGLTENQTIKGCFSPDTSLGLQSSWSKTKFLTKPLI